MRYVIVGVVGVPVEGGLLKCGYYLVLLGCELAGWEN